VILYSKLTAVLNYLYLSLAIGFYLLAAFVDPGAGLVIIPFFLFAPIVAAFDIIYLIMFFVHRKTLLFPKHRKVFIPAISGAGIILLIQLLLLVLFVTGLANGKDSFNENKRLMRQFDSCRIVHTVEFCAQED
jgi:hypothetical protein